MISPKKFFCIYVLLLGCVQLSEAIEDSKRLFDDLLRDYNRIMRPVVNTHDKMSIYLKLKLSQIIKVHEKDQILTTSIWLRQEWFDYHFIWNPSQYGGITSLYVPYEMIWVPDLVLYNNGDSNYNLTISTKATILHTGMVIWEPPAIFKSMCMIDVQWFPFDEQNCFLKFGSWTYDETLLDLQHFVGADINYELEVREVSGYRDNVSVVKRGIDLSDYHPSVEWEILEIPAKRHSSLYQSCCPDLGSFADITYYLNLRRKPLFYTVNLIIPCVSLSGLTMLVFYLPSDSGEKITLCISILVSLTVFFLLLIDLIPATSVTLPLIGKYLLFTMVMVSISVIITIVALNVHFRSPSTHTMPKWVKMFFIEILPKYLFMRRPLIEGEESFRRVSSKHFSFERSQRSAVSSARSTPQTTPKSRKRLAAEDQKQLENIYYTPTVLKAFDNVCYIAQILRARDKNDRMDEDWKYVAMVVDRLFLWFFCATCFFGTVIILLEAPSFYDTRLPLI